MRAARAPHNKVKLRRVRDGQWVFHLLLCFTFCNYYINYMVYILGKRYVPEKEYIHMISSYITADWSNIE